MSKWPREGRWLKKPRKVRPAFFTLYLWAHTPFVLFRVAAHNYPETVRWSTRLHAAFLVTGAILYAINEMRIRRRRRIDEALTERPEDLTEYPVEAAIYVNDRPLGLDRGVACFEEGRFGFVGSSFSFLLEADNFLNDKMPSPGKIGGANRLQLRAMGGKAHLVVKPLFGYRRSYAASLKEFFHEAKVTGGELQWPPLTDYLEPTSLASSTERRPEFEALTGREEERAVERA